MTPWVMPGYQKVEVRHESQTDDETTETAICPSPKNVLDGGWRVEALKIGTGEPHELAASADVTLDGPVGSVAWRVKVSTGTPPDAYFHRLSVFAICAEIG